MEKYETLISDWQSLMSSGYRRHVWFSFIILTLLPSVCENFYYLLLGRKLTEIDGNMDMNTEIICFIYHLFCLRHNLIQIK